MAEAVGVRRPETPARVPDGLDGVKLLALVLMTVDHALIGLDDPWAHLGYLAGRPCVALFSWILAMRLAAGDAARSARVTRRLALWGLVAAPIYWLLTHHLELRANILFTLAIGAGLIWLLQTRRTLAAGVLALASLAAWPWLDGGGLAPVAMAGGWVLVGKGRLWLALLAVTAASLVHNAIVMPSYWPALAAVASAPLLAFAVRPAGRFVPHLPWWAFYAYYPAHLAVILLLLGPYR